MNKEDILKRLNGAKLAVNEAIKLIDLADDRQHDLDMQAEELERQRNVLINKENELNRSATKHRGELDRVRQMESLAKKIKLDSDEQKEKFIKKEEDLQKRLQKVSQLEEQKKTVEAKDKELNKWEDGLEEREMMIGKDKANLRSKLEDIEIREKAISNREKRLQRQISATKK